ncbi:hypothetical protein D3C75_766360 [compost metagenome]
MQRRLQALSCSDQKDETAALSGVDRGFLEQKAALLLLGMIAELLGQQEHFIPGILRHAGKAAESLGHCMDRQPQLCGQMLQCYFFADGHMASLL